jgi:hypothetical protein
MTPRLRCTTTALALALWATVTMAHAGPHATVEFVATTAQGQAVATHGRVLRDVRDIQIQVWWSVRGAHVQTLKVIAPDGSLYQSVTTSFNGDVRRRTFEHGGDTLVQTLLPVAGTWITEYSIEGHWTIEVYMDDVARPAATSMFLLYR